MKLASPRGLAAWSDRWGAFWDGGARTFVYQGTNGRWRDVLSAADCSRYEETARRELGEACARWLATGELPDQDAG